MGERFFVDTEGLNRGSGEFGDIGERVRQVASGAVTSAEGLGPVWGNDSAGKKFAQSYLPAKTNFLEGVFALGDVMRATGDGVRTMSKTFAKTEDGATQLAGKVGEIMPNLPEGGGTFQARRESVSAWQPMHVLKATKSQPTEAFAAKRLGLAGNRLVAMDGHLRAEYKRRGVEYPEPLQGTEQVLLADKKLRLATENLGLEYPGITPTEPELREAGVRLAAENQRLTEVQHHFEAKDDQLRAEYERRGLDYESPWGPPVQATPAMMARHTTEPAPAPDPWTQAVELSDSADRIREAKDRLVEVDRNLRAASERLGWAYP